MDDFAKEQKKTNRQLNRNAKRKAAMVEMQGYIDTNWNGLSIVGSTYATISSVNALSNSLANKGMFEVGWKKFPGFTEGLERLSATVSGGVEGAICKRKLGDKSNSLLLNDGGSSSLYSSAANIAALRRYEGKDASGRDLYSYIINAYVMNQRDVEENLSFSIILKPGDQLVAFDQDVNLLLITTYDLSFKQKKTPWTNQHPLMYPFNNGVPSDDYVAFSTTQKFNEVCLVFHNDNPEYWFDVSRRNVKSLCRGVELG
jgi:hypothetical protein